MDFLTRKIGMKPGKEVVSIEGKFHDADIQDGMILGYPWMILNSLAILPHSERCVATMEQWLC